MSEAKLPKVVVEQTEPVEAPDADDIALTKVIVEDEAAQDKDAEELVPDGAVTDEGPLEEDEQDAVAADEEAEGAAEDEPQEPGEAESEETVEHDESVAAGASKPAPKVAVASVPLETAAPAEPNSWLHRQFPGHEHAVVGCLTGLFFALVVLFVGIPRGLFIIACMAVGILVGMYFDGDSRLMGAVRALRGKK